MSTFNTNDYLIGWEKEVRGKIEELKFEIANKELESARLRLQISVYSDPSIKRYYDALVNSLFERLEQIDKDLDKIRTNISEQSLLAEAINMKQQK